MKVRYQKNDMDLVMVEGAEAAGIVAVEKLNLFLGEWYRDENAGIPWLDNILGNKATAPVINFLGNYIYNELSVIPGVTSVEVTKLDFNTTTRHLLVAVTLTYMEEETINLEQDYGL